MVILCSKGTYSGSPASFLFSLTKDLYIPYQERVAAPPGTSAASVAGSASVRSGATGAEGDEEEDLRAMSDRRVQNMALRNLGVQEQLHDPSQHSVSARCPGCIDGW